MQKFINIHTHKKTKDDIISIENTYPFQWRNDQHYNHLCSVGMHPWFLNKRTLDEEFTLMSDILHKKNIVAIGEVGLDKVCETPFAIQQKTFEFQLELAEQFNKPLIIHCVRAYTEIVHYKKTSKHSLPWIIHAFKGNIETASQLMKHGFVLSFDSSICNPKSKVTKTLAQIETNNFFLETDDSSIPIQKVYSCAANIRGVPLDVLLKQQNENFKQLT